jgi:putative transcriptional regulator
VFQARRKVQMARRGVALVAVVFALALLVRTAGIASQNGTSPPKPGGLAGQFLVAAESMGDPRFVRTVIFVVQHDTAGAMGLIVNRPVGELPMAKLLEGIGLDGTGLARTVRLHYGGPVEPRHGLTLHTTDYGIEGTLRITAGIALTGQPEILRAIGAGRGPKRYLIALGYAGWAAGQLESEIKAGGWVVVPADEELVFDENYEKKWERAMARQMIRL